MPTFCRHNRFIERCPICRKTLPGGEPAAGAQSRRASGAGGVRGTAEAPRRPRAEGVRVRHEGRTAEDGYRNALAPGLRASGDAERLAQEISFASGRLAALAMEPPGLYGQARGLGASDLERATWICFLLAYLCPTEDPDPFASVAAVLEAAPGPFQIGSELDLDAVALGPRTSHEHGRGTATLRAYADWVRRGGRSAAGPAAGAGGAPGAQEQAFTGDAGWSPQRRFERLFERLALPGLSRGARFELLVVLGRLGLYELGPDSLHLSSTRGSEDSTTAAAKRVFGIGDPLLLERRADGLAVAAAVPRESLDLALYNWDAPVRADMGFSPELRDEAADARLAAALGL